MSGLDSLPHIPTLSNETVILRPLAVSDSSDLWAYYSDPEVFGPTSLDVDSLQATQDAIASMNAYFARRESIRWGMVLPGAQGVLGDCGFFGFTDAAAEIGYLLAREYWGRGIASAAVDLLLVFGYESIGLAEVEATVMEGNDRSLRLLERKGFERRELIRRYKNVRGVNRNFWHLKLARLRVPATA